MIWHLIYLNCLLLGFHLKIMVSLYCVIPSMECPLFPINLIYPSTYFKCFDFVCCFTFFWAIFYLVRVFLHVAIFFIFQDYDLYILNALFIIVVATNRRKKKPVINSFFLLSQHDSCRCFFVSIH